MQAIQYRNNSSYRTMANGKRGNRKKTQPRIDVYCHSIARHYIWRLQFFFDQFVRACVCVCVCDSVIFVLSIRPIVSHMCVSFIQLHRGSFFVVVVVDLLVSWKSRNTPNVVILPWQSAMFNMTWFFVGCCCLKDFFSRIMTTWIALSITNHVWSMTKVQKCIQ